jgi:hypothetical protein
MVTVVVSLTMMIKITIAAIGLMVTIVPMVTSATTLVIKVSNCSGTVIKTDANGQEQGRDLTTRPIE